MKRLSNSATMNIKHFIEKNSMIYGIKKREYKKEIQQKERQNISKYQNIKRGICIDD